MMLVSIADMYVQCSLQLRNFDRPGVAMSDCCSRPANTGVLLSDGKIMWRCIVHEGERDIRSLELGPVVTKIVRN